MTTQLRALPDPALASPGARLGAAAVDVLIVGTGVLVVSALLGAVLPPAVGASAGLLWTIALVAVLVVAPMWEVLTRGSGGTLGKRFAGIEVRSIDGTVPSAARMSWRFLVRLVGALPLGAGFLVALPDPRRRTLADRAASTVVLRRAARVTAVPPLPLPAWDADRLAGPPRWEDVVRRMPVAAGVQRPSTVAAGVLPGGAVLASSEPPWGPPPSDSPGPDQPSAQPPTQSEPVRPGGSSAWGEQLQQDAPGSGTPASSGGGFGGSFGGGGSSDGGRGDDPFGGSSFGGGSADDPGGSDRPGDEAPAAGAVTPPEGWRRSRCRVARPLRLRRLHLAVDPNVVAIEEAGLGGEAATWLTQVAGQVELRLDRINRQWRTSPGSEAAPAVAFGLLLGHLARIYPHMRHDLERTAESHPSYSTLGSGSRLSTLEQLAADRARLAAWLGPLVGTTDAARVASVLD